MVAHANRSIRNMQDCFRQHPDIYGAELEDDEDDYEGAEGGFKAPADSSPDAAAPATSTPAPSNLPPPIYDSKETPAPAAKREEPEPTIKKEKAKAATEQVKKEHEPSSESEELVPRAAHDAR
jgi:intermembrane space import and assembly protein 40